MPVARVCAAIGVCLLVPLLGVQAAIAATAWPVSLTGSSNGLGRAGTSPAAPTAVTTACTSGLLGAITVTWAASARATSYSVLRSSTGPNGTYTVAASGVTGTSWTSPALAAGTYYFQVQSFAGSFWNGGVSAAAGPRTLTLALICS